MGSHAKIGGYKQSPGSNASFTQGRYAANPAGTAGSAATGAAGTTAAGTTAATGTAAATPAGTAGPTTTAKMTPWLQKNPVSVDPIKNFIPGVSDKGPKLPAMMAGYDAHGNPIPVAAQPRDTLAGIVNLLPWRTGGSSSDRGGYTTSGRGWGGNSSAGAGYGMGGRGGG